MRYTLLVTLLLAALATVFAAPAPDGAPNTFASHLAARQAGSSAFPDPNDDPFYVAPSDLANYKPGEIIRARPVVTTIPANLVKSSFQVLYRTTDTQGNPEATVGTIWEPVKAKSTPQILSMHVFMDSVQLDCNPSWAYVQGSASNSKATTGLDTPIYISYALSQGIHVVSPDHEGPKASFIAGYQQGMAGHDGMRAIKKHYTLPTNTEIAFVGYSGGASVSVWVANLSPNYPDNNIIGSAFGGTPISTRQTFTFLNGGLFAGFAAAGLLGIMTQYPELDAYINSHVSANGRTQIARFRSRNFCVGQVATGAPFTDIITAYAQGASLYDPVPAKVLAKETLLMTESSVPVNVPTFPRLQFHALLDEIVPFAPELQYVQEQCAHGANIQFQTFPVAEHITAEILGIAGAINFLNQVYTHTVPKVICGTALPSFLSLKSPQAASLLGQSTINRLLALNGTKSATGETIRLPPL